MITVDTLQQFLYRHRSDGRFLGSGATRVAYYCKKYDRVFKYSIQGWDKRDGDSQAVTEFKRSQSLPDKYKKYVPVEQYAQVNYEGRLVDVIVMPLVKPLDTDSRMMETWYKERRNYRDIFEFVANYYHMGLMEADNFRQFIHEFHVDDLQNCNVGTHQGHFVMVDAGF